MTTRDPPTLRPHARRLAAPILDVVPLADGGLAVLTSRGVELLDEALAPTAIIPGEGLRGHQLVALADGRFLVRESRFTELHVGARGGTFAKVDLEGSLCHDVAATSDGFLATVGERALVDRHGERRWLELPGRVSCGVVPWDGGAVVAGFQGIAVLDASGGIRALHDVPVRERPVALDSGVALPGGDEVAVFDGASVATTIPIEAHSDALAAFATGVVHSDDRGMCCWRLYDDAFELAWSWSRPVALQYPAVVGDWLVVGAWQVATAWILDTSGTLVDEVPLSGSLVEACAFGDGIALRAQASSDLVWWRPGRAVAPLPHDVEATLIRTAGAALVSAEADVLYCWRTDTQGPELPALATGGLPLDVPIVIDGEVLTVRAGGHFALRGVTARGQLTHVAPGARFRPATTRAEALALLDELAARRFDGELPAVSFEGTYAEVTTRLAQLPLAETLALHGRALFAPGTLDPSVRRSASFARAAWLGELGLALDLSARRVAAALRAGRFPLEPPRPVPGYEYLGAFTSSGDLTVGDPCYVGKKSRGTFPLTLEIQALPGTFHVFVRPGVLTDAGRTAELVVIHADGFDVLAADELGSIAVDSATAGVFDRACPGRDEEAPMEEGVVFRRGAVAWAGLGDGFYGVFGGSTKGRIAKVRIHFLGPSAAGLDATMATKATAPRRYAPSERFEAGDAVEHSKFGAGTVARVRADGKIDVVFGDGPRVLVHKGGPARS